MNWDDWESYMNWDDWESYKNWGGWESQNGKESCGDVHW